MRLINLNKSASIVAIAYYILATVRGTEAITGGTLFKYYPMADVTNLIYQTVFLFQRRVEDVGSLEVLSIVFAVLFQYKGSGSIRWQISGDGGSTFVTFAERDLFVEGVLIQGVASGSGLWITSIQPGNNKLQIRMQVKSTFGGVVSTLIGDNSIMILTYRKKVLF